MCTLQKPGHLIEKCFAKFPAIRPQNQNNQRNNQNNQRQNNATKNYCHFCETDTLIKINLSTVMKGKWLFDTGAGLQANSKREEADQINFKPKGSKRCFSNNSNP
jgi:hypothetical protein